MKKKVLVTMGAALVVLGAAGCSSEKASPETTPAAVQSEAGAEIAGTTDISGMELSILGSYHEDMVKRQAELFEQKTGCKVTYLRMPTGEAVAKLTAEKDNPTVNVYIGGTVDAHENLKEQGILAAYHSPVEGELPAAYVDPDGVWKGQYLETLSIGVNTERWEEEFADLGIEMPTTLEELLNPAFKGEIITPNPATSGTGYAFVSSVLDYFGEEEGWKYIEAFNEQIGQYTSSGYTPAEKAGLGEYLICVNFLADQLIVQTSGYPMTSTVYEGAGWSMCPVSIMEGSQTNPAAQQFIDFCLGKEALDSLVELANVVAVRDDCIAPEGGSKLSELNFNRDYDPIGAAAHKKDTIEKLSAIIE